MNIGSNIGRIVAIGSTALVLGLGSHVALASVYEVEVDFFEMIQITEGSQYDKNH
jgi:hypothetical protein